MTSNISQAALEYTIDRGAGMGLQLHLPRSLDPLWFVAENGFMLEREHEIESLFSLSNGYSGMRASLEEGSRLSRPATFVAGVFENPVPNGGVPGLTTFPGWTGVKVFTDGDQLTMENGEVCEHRRILDFRQGILWREWRQRDTHGRITRLLTFRLASLVDRHLLLQGILLTAENYSGVVTFHSSIELASATESGLPQQWKVRRDPERPEVIPFSFAVPGNEIVAEFALTSQLLNSSGMGGEREIKIESSRIGERVQVELGVGATCRLHRAVSIFTSRDVLKPFETALRHVTSAQSAGFDAAARAHAFEWRTRWDGADVSIEGDDSLQRAARFAVYHLVSAANPEDSRVSIGARGLTGQAYKGHVFWDTEIYMLPFFTYTHPACARALLCYRYHTLEAAREKARSAGFRGAMYAWESADTGMETTPKYTVAPTGNIIRVLNGELEVHISADIAYAVWQYWQATLDTTFLLEAGAEIILETARFWASRGSVESDGKYHIRHVIGPDEYHENVDDNAFTNLMAAWNLRHGAKTARLLKEKWPDRWHELAARIRISDQELNQWPNIADAMYTGFDPKTRLFEQFAGYFQKEEVDLQTYEPRSVAMDIILGHERIQQTNIVKQADVNMALYLLTEQFSQQVCETNFHYYEPRTAHGSSLSPSIHALLAARMGDMDLASRYLKRSAEIDLGNNMGNAAGGVHLAAQGGLWQSLVFGFAGLRPCPDELCLAPRLLPHWRELSFPVRWRNCNLNIKMTPREIQVVVQGSGSLTVRLLGGPVLAAVPNHEYSTERMQNGWSEWHIVR